jgi:pyruvate carboxylase
MAIFLATHGMTMADFEALGTKHSLTLPNSVVEMFAGSLGQPDGGWPKTLQKQILRDQEPVTGRPGASMPPVDFDHTATQIERLIGRPPSKDEVMSYVMYPDVFIKFARAQESYGDLDVLPTKPFFYGMKTGEDITIELEPGKTIVVRFLTVGELRPDGHRTVFFELNGQPREVSIRDRSQKVAGVVKEYADPNHRGHIGSPTPGVVTSVLVEQGQAVKEGQKLLILEAMKMQSTVYASVAGKVAKRFVQPGQTVETKELLLVIE